MNTGIHSLELLQRVRIRPYPRTGGHGDGCVVERGAKSGGSRSKMRGATEPRTGYATITPSTQEDCNGRYVKRPKQQEKSNRSTPRCGQLKRAVDLGKQTRPPPQNGAVNPLRPSHRVHSSTSNSESELQLPYRRASFTHPLRGLFILSSSGCHRSPCITATLMVS